MIHLKLQSNLKMAPLAACIKLVQFGSTLGRDLPALKQYHNILFQCNYPLLQARSGNVYNHSAAQLSKLSELVKKDTKGHCGEVGCFNAANRQEKKHSLPYSSNSIFQLRCKQEG